MIFQGNAFNDNWSIDKSILFIGTAGAVAFDVMPTSSLEEMLTSAPGAGNFFRIYFEQKNIYHFFMLCYSMFFVCFFAGGGLSGYDETALAYNAFRVLRTMVSYYRFLSIAELSYKNILIKLCLV